MLDAKYKDGDIKVRKILKKFLLVINIISFALVSLFGASGIIFDLFGAATYEKMLVKLGIPWSFESVWVFMYVCLFISITSYFLRKKFFE